MFKQELTKQGYPRRNDISQLNDTEKTINRAISLIEDEEASVLLTDSQTKLQEAFDLYADWNESKRKGLSIDDIDEEREMRKREEEVDRNGKIISSFIEHCEVEGLEISDSLFESFFGA